MERLKESKENKGKKIVDRGISFFKITNLVLCVKADVQVYTNSPDDLSLLMEIHASVLPEHYQKRLEELKDAQLNLVHQGNKTQKSSPHYIFNPQHSRDLLICFKHSRKFWKLNKKHVTMIIF